MFYVPFVKKMDILLNGKNGMNFSDSKYVQKIILQINCQEQDKYGQKQDKFVNGHYSIRPKFCT